MDLIKKGKKYFMETYNQFPIVFEKGENAYLYDKEGDKYLDFMSGIAVNSLGYQDEDLKEALIDQINKYVHCSNYYYNEPAIETAELLVKLSGLDKVFLCSTGTEANEGAIKLARKYGYEKKHKDCNKIISLKQSFHGRSLGALAVTGQTKLHKGFSPLIPGVEYVSINDIDDIKQAIDDDVCGIIVEPIQGESGIYELDKKYVKEVRHLCDKNDIVLIFDEVQTGIGRTGQIFAYQGLGVKPDVITLAKGLGSGVPVGAIVAKESVAGVFKPGDHGTTFGGNPLATTASKIVLTKLSNPSFLNNIKSVSDYLIKKLDEIVDKYEFAKERRGKGLMQGIEIDVPVAPIIKSALDKKLLIIKAGTNVLRFVPPLIITKEQVDEMIDILNKTFKEVIYEN
ncbi:MAG: aspartate aminotransferase family protein [Eubacteriales bacterium]